MFATSSVPQQVVALRGLSVADDLRRVARGLQQVQTVERHLDEERADRSVEIVVAEDGFAISPCGRGWNHTYFTA